MAQNLLSFWHFTLVVDCKAPVNTSVRLLTPLFTCELSLILASIAPIAILVCCRFSHPAKTNMRLNTGGSICIANKNVMTARALRKRKQNELNYK
jgi:hypothetical protein